MRVTAISNFSFFGVQIWLIPLRCLNKKFQIDLTKLQKSEYDEIISLIGSAVHTITKKVVTFKLCYACFELVWNHFKQLIDIYKGKRHNGKNDKKRKRTLFRSFSLENRLSLIDAEILEELANHTESYQTEGQISKQIKSNDDISHRYMASSKASKSNLMDPLNILIKEMKGQFSSSVVKRIEENLIPLLMDINVSDDINSGLNLSNYIKIYDQTTNHEEQTLEIIEGTILKRLIRHKHFINEEVFPEIMLISLPINFSLQTSNRLSKMMMSESMQ